MTECAQESNVLAALTAGAMPEELAAHLAECGVCQDAELAWSYLKECAVAETVSDVPPAGVVWWKAQLAKKRAEARRSIAWIEAMQKIALAVVAIAVIAIAAWQGPKLFNVSPLLAAASGAVLVLLVASVLVMHGLDRWSHDGLSRGA
ncbi:MAG: hypothetical protein JO340_10780 [Acidobacteriaceae bacterium]|nr:hypothetical protein [Acidobacteriaceae bacterium]